MTYFQDIVSHAVSGNAVELANSVNAAMAEKISATLDSMRHTLADKIVFGEKDSIDTPVDITGALTSDEIVP